mgnify:CR=1 FL=1
MGEECYKSQQSASTQVQASNTERSIPMANEVKTSCYDDMVLAMAYVKWQTWQNIYDAEKALHHGTIFQELDLPFCGIGGCQK